MIFCKVGLKAGKTFLILTSMTLTFFVPGKGEASKSAPQYNRAVSSGQAAKEATISLLNDSFDVCNARNVASNLGYFWRCVQLKLPNYTTNKNGQITWDKSKIFSTIKGSIQTTTVPTVITNMGLLTQWRALYANYTQLRREMASLIDQMVEGVLDGNEDVIEEQINDFNRQMGVKEAQLDSVRNSWATFVNNNNLGKFVSPNWPVAPDPTSSTFSTPVSKSGVFMISEDFYADFRALLDSSPNMHLQLLKYYLVTTPSLFNSMTKPQTEIAKSNKMFRVSLICADTTSVEGALLGIAAAAAPPLPYPILQSCQFSAQRVGLPSDGDPIQVANNGGYSTSVATSPTGKTFSF